MPQPAVRALEAWELLVAWMRRERLIAADLARILGTGESQIHRWCHRGPGPRHARPLPELRWRIQQVTDGAVPAVAWATAAELARFQAVVAHEQQAAQLERYARSGARKVVHFGRDEAGALRRAPPQVFGRRERLTWRDLVILHAYWALGQEPPPRIVRLTRHARPRARRLPPRAAPRGGR